MTDHELIANLHRRMDTQDKMLLEIRDQMNRHLAESEASKQSLDELVTIWKGSKLLIPLMAGICAAAWSFIVWAKQHVTL